jgi:NADPH2:quinone reductase
MYAIEVAQTGGPEVLSCVEKPCTRDEFTWRTNQLFDAITTGTVRVTVSAHYPLKDAAQAHRDLEGRRTVGSVVLTP